MVTYDLFFLWVFTTVNFRKFPAALATTPVFRSCSAYCLRRRKADCFSALSVTTIAIKKKNILIRIWSAIWIGRLDSFRREHLHAAVGIFEKDSVNQEYKWFRRSFHSRFAVFSARDFRVLTMFFWEQYFYRRLQFSAEQLQFKLCRCELSESFL